MPPLFTAIVVPLQAPEVIVPTVARLASVMMFCSEVVADILLSQRVFRFETCEPVIDKFASVMMFGKVVVADNLLSNLLSVQKRLEPSVKSLVLIPRVEVATRE